MPSTTDERLTQQAMAAYFRSGGFDQPAHGGNVLEHDGKLYVVLSNIKGTLAVYRARPRMVSSVGSSGGRPRSPSRELVGHVRRP